MIKLINGRGQLGEALKKLIDKEKLSLDATIYHTWNFLDKSELIQKECFNRFKDYVDNNSKERLVFISTYSQTDNFYNFFKQLSEDYLLKNQERGGVIRLPTLIGKGICEKFRNNEVKPFGEIELMTLEDVAKKVLDLTKTDSLEKIFRVKGKLVDAKLAKDLILFGRNGK